MSNSTVTFDAIAQSQASKEVTANAYFDAASPATLFGRRQSTTSGLTWGYYGGTIMVDAALAQIANGTLALTASVANFIEATRAGVISSNTSAWTPGKIPLYRLAKTMTDANTTLAANEERNEILEFTGTLTVQRNIVLPLGAQQWTVFNNTTGGFGLQFIGATGTGVVVAAGMRAIIYADGTNVVRVTADV